MNQLAKHLAVWGAVASFSVATAAHATVFNVNSVFNGADTTETFCGYYDAGCYNGGTPFDVGPVNTGIFVNAGDTVTLGINPNDTWGFNGGAVTALGTYAFGWAPWNTFAPPGDSTPWGAVQYGSVAWSLDGTNWGAGYTDTGTTGTVTTAYGTYGGYPIWTVGTSFIAPTSGFLLLGMWDSVVYDNNGGGAHPTDNYIAVDVDVTSPAPEPASLALLGMGLAGLGILRRRKHS